MEQPIGPWEQRVITDDMGRPCVFQRFLLCGDDECPNGSVLLRPVRMIYQCTADGKILWVAP